MKKIIATLMLLMVLSVQAFAVTVSGTAYQNDGVTPISGAVVVAVRTDCPTTCVHTAISNPFGEYTIDSFTINDAGYDFVFNTNKKNFTFNPFLYNLTGNATGVNIYAN